MKVAKRAGLALCAMAASLALARVHPFGEPERDARQAREELLRSASMPEDARHVLMSKCADCHSNATHWPVYARVAPASWLMERDVVEGRRHLNLSHWSELSADRQQALEQEIARQASKGEMPPVQYRLVHWASGLNAGDRAALSGLGAGGDAGTSTAMRGDAGRGQAVFEKRCTGCHALDANREGPHLRGVYGRRAGTAEGFRYSPALRQSGVTWTDATLERWLRDTDMMVRGNAMGFSVPKAQERADLVAFLKGLG